MNIEYDTIKSRFGKSRLDSIRGVANAHSYKKCEIKKLKRYCVSTKAPGMVVFLGMAAISIIGNCKEMACVIGFAIYGFLLFCAFYAWFPGMTAWIVPVFIISVIIGAVLKGLFRSSQNEHTKKDDVPRTEYDEFDWWQDNQGL